MNEKAVLLGVLLGTGITFALVACAANLWTYLVVAAASVAVGVVGLLVTRVMAK